MITYEDKNYVTPREAAQMLSIHIATVYNWCSRKQVELLDVTALNIAGDSKYLIEIDSLRARHAKVYLNI